MNNSGLNFVDAQELRRKAEEKLKGNAKNVSKSAKETDSKRLLHELQVHQIELEMQNEELREANFTAETALKKYTMLYDFAPMGYLTLDEDGSILELNFTAAELLRGRRFSFINKNLKLFVSDDSHSKFDKFIKKIYSGLAKESCEIILGYDKKILSTVYIEGIVTNDDHKCLLSLVDISNFRK